MNMNTTALLVALLALGAIGLLPVVFFRAGRLNRRWWLTAAPFLASGANVLPAFWKDIPEGFRFRAPVGLRRDLCALEDRSDGALVARKEPRRLGQNRNGKRREVGAKVIVDLSRHVGLRGARAS